MEAIQYCMCALSLQDTPECIQTAQTHAYIYVFLLLSLLSLSLSVLCALFISLQHSLAPINDSFDACYFEITLV